MGMMVVFTNALEGRDDAFNEWYDVRRGRLDRHERPARVLVEDG